MKKFLLLLFVFLCAIPLGATTLTYTGDPFTISYTAYTCDTCWGPGQNLPHITLNAIMTVVPATGQFWIPDYADYTSGPVLMITSLAGTLKIDNCQYPFGCTPGTYDVSLGHVPGDGGWLYPCCKVGDFAFTNGSSAGGQIDWDLSLPVAYGSWGTTPVTEQWTRIESVPELPSLTLLPLGLFGVFLVYRLKRAKA